MKIRITDLNKGDAYFDSRDRFINEIFTLGKNSMVEQSVFGGDWKYGEVYNSKNESYIFSGFKYEEIKDQESQTV